MFIPNVISEDVITGEATLNLLKKGGAVNIAALAAELKSMAESEPDKARTAQILATRNWIIKMRIGAENDNRPGSALIRLSALPGSVQFNKTGTQTRRDN